MRNKLSETFDNLNVNPETTEQVNQLRAKFQEGVQTLVTESENAQGSRGYRQACQTGNRHRRAGFAEPEQSVTAGHNAATIKLLTRPNYSRKLFERAKYLGQILRGEIEFRQISKSTSYSVVSSNLMSYHKHTRQLTNDC